MHAQKQLQRKTQRRHREGICFTFDVIGNPNNTSNGVGVSTPIDESLYLYLGLRQMLDTNAR